VRGLNLAIVGAGAVGKTILEILEERKFPVASLKILATERSAGKSLQFCGENIVVEPTSPQSFTGIDLALFAGGNASKEFASSAVKAKAVVIDNSSTFRLDPEVPLVVPEVNPQDVMEHKGIIANPNCSTIQMVVALKPLHDLARLTRVIVSTYQAVSGAGQEAMDELAEQTRAYLNHQETEPRVFPHPIAFNLIPHIDRFLDNGYTKEEMKMVNETRKILHEPDLKIAATTVRVPVFRSHSEAINVETEKELSPEEAREAFRRQPGIVVIDDPAGQAYPMPLDCSNRDEVFVGRIRQDLSAARGLVFWVVADQLRKGAATNAVQIAELLGRKGMLG